MKAVCVSNFNYYDRRIVYAHRYLESKGYEVTYITGDYDTMNRQMYHLDLPQAIQLPLIQYKKNISFERIYSHYKFAKAVYRQLLAIKPEVIYAMVPPNFIVHFIAKYKKKYPNTVIIFDVFDMWPETYPLPSKAVLRLPFRGWQKLRTNGFNEADGVLSECVMFEEHLRALQPHLPVRTLYPCQKPSEQALDYYVDEGVIGLCYLGSINNIIDIDHIFQVISQLAKAKQVDLHIIGNGEKITDFMAKMEPVCRRIINHGNLYDEKAKQAVFNQCAFGINILKPTVFIGLTLKTIDYLKGGLPLLNTVQGDTKKMIEEDGIGINVCNVETIAPQVAHLTLEHIMEMKHNSRKAFQRYFSEETYTDLLETALQQMEVSL